VKKKKKKYPQSANTVLARHPSIYLHTHSPQRVSNGARHDAQVHTFSLNS
jgi:hypothetical protein